MYIYRKWGLMGVLRYEETNKTRLSGFCFFLRINSPYMTTEFILTSDDMCNSFV